MIPEITIPDLTTRTAIAEPLLIGLLSLIVLALWWNKGNSTNINARAQDEPAVGALAAILIFVGGLAVYAVEPWTWIPELPGTLMIALGVFLFLLATVAVYSHRVNLDLY